MAVDTLPGEFNLSIFDAITSKRVEWERGLAILNAAQELIEDPEVGHRLVRRVGGNATALEALRARLQAFSPSYVEGWLECEPATVLSATQDGEALIGAIEDGLEDLCAADRRVVILAAQFPGGIRTAIFREAMILGGSAVDGVEDAIARCIDQKLLWRTDKAGVCRVMPLVAVLLRAESRDQVVDRSVMGPMASYVVEIHERVTGAESDAALGDELQHLTREGPQWLAWMRRHLNDALPLEPPVQKKLLRLVVEFGLRRAVGASDREQITACVDSVGQISDLDADALESVARWRRRIGDLELADQYFDKALQASDPVPPRLYWRWSDVLRLRRKSRRLQTLIDAGVERLDEMSHESVCCERIALLMTDSRSDAADDVIDGGRGAPDQWPSIDSDALHALDAQMVTSVRLSRRFWARHEFESQRRLLEDAHRRCDALGDLGWRPLCLHGIGSSLFSSGDSEAGLEYYERALAGYQEIGHAVHIATLTGALAGLHHHRDQIDRALTLYRRALDAHLRMGTAREAAGNHFGLGCALFEADQFQSALEQLAIARQQYRDAEEFADAGRVALIEAWIESWAGDQGRARDRFDEAQAYFGRDDPHHWMPVVELSRHRWLDEGLPDAGRKAWRQRLATAPPASVARYLFSHIADQSLSADAIAELRRRSVALRVLLEITEQSRELEESVKTPDLVVGPQAYWFKLPDEERVDIHSRGSIQLIFKALMASYHREAAQGLDVHQLFEIGWPDEEATEESAANRVYWAIRTLRQLGLEDILVTGTDGYFLDPTATICQGSE